MARGEFRTFFDGLVEQGLARVGRAMAKQRGDLLPFRQMEDGDSLRGTGISWQFGRQRGLGI